MAHVVGTHRRFDILFQDEEEEDDDDEDEENAGLTFIKVPEDDVDDLNNASGNAGVSEAFATLARELDVERRKHRKMFTNRICLKQVVSNAARRIKLLKLRAQGKIWHLFCQRFC